MPPYTFPYARLLYVLTALVAASIVLTLDFAGAGQPEAQCKGNSPKKTCPDLTPADGATVSATVLVTAQVDDPVASMTFEVDDKALAPPDLTAPYETGWDTTKWSNGTHILKATAVDASGKASSREHRIDVSNAAPKPTDTTAPSVALTSPSAGATVSGSVSVAADASDNVGVVGVQFKVDGANVGAEDTSAPYAVSWSSTAVANGSHTVTAVARDAAGNSSNSQRSVNVSNSSGGSGDTTAPTVGLTSPAAGATVSGSVSVGANASDNVGVVGVQFKVDGANVGAEDTSAPYAVSWSSTAVANGSHTVTAVARDAAGNSSNSQRSVTVSNSTSSGDTTAPTVGLTSPSAGATVSGSASVAATASDNVAVAGVQFKVDGANVGAEDTSAPYAASWNTGSVSNGSHTVTAVARDAAGNSASSQRSVTVSNSTSSSGPKLAWAPPTLSNPVTITVTNANRRLFLDNTRDYRLNIAEPLKRELWIEGGRNVVVIGGHITIDQLGADTSYQDNTAVKVRFGDPSGTVHLEGLLIDGPYVNDGIGIATGRNVQIENVRIERAYDDVKGGHADCVQIQQGVGQLRMDRFTCTTERQGVFLGDHDGPIRGADLRHVNMYAAGGKHLFFQTTPTYRVDLSEVWLAIASGYTQWASFGYWVYPQEDGRTYTGVIDPNRRSVVASDGLSLSFIGSNIYGRINKGVPSGGDFVTRAVVGSSYTSPGYG